MTDSLLTFVDGTGIVTTSYTFRLALGLTEQLQFNSRSTFSGNVIELGGIVLWNSTDRCLIR
jgi:hypothetical protein